MAQKSLTRPTLFNLPITRLPSFPTFDHLIEGWGTTLGSLTSSGLNVFEKGKNIIVEAALPGLKRSDIEVTLDKSILFIRGNRKEEQASKDKQYFRKSNFSFIYNIDLPSNTEFSKEPRTEYKDGILTLTFGKKNQRQPKQIQIK